MDDPDSPVVAPLVTLLTDLGRRLEAYRISRNLKQAELAQLAGISRSTLARLEAGQGGTIDSLVRVMRALNLGDRLLALLPDATLSPLDPRSASAKPRRRVRHSGKKAADGRWTWGDEAP